MKMIFSVRLGKVIGYCAAGLTGLSLLLGLAACTGQAGRLGEAQVLDAAWAALEPYTASHNRANWQAVDLRQVTGQEVAEEFSREPASCVHPTPPANGAISPAATYWYVEWRPRPATPKPQPGTPSPTAPPLVPEAFLPRALILLDSSDGRVVARRLLCIIY